MTPTLIVLALAVIAVAIVAWAVRKKPARPYQERVEQDTAWNDPVKPAEADPFAAASAKAPPADPHA